mgnify:CR=1 FL=1
MEGKDALEILNRGFTHSIKDPLWQNVYMTKDMKSLLETEEVQKLSRIKQNGPAYLVYPGAVHTRLSHSIGVYNLGREMLLSIARKTDKVHLTETGMLSFLAACLLHDIGHFPYAHSLKELAIKEHEELGSILITDDAKLNKAIAKTGADPLFTAAIIDKDMLNAEDEVQFYRSLLSGTLDPDKLDYLSRDGFFAGIPYGKQDTAYIISALSVESRMLCLDEDAISSVEQILFSKYMMYRTLYWHKDVRSATAMIKKALIMAIAHNAISFNDLYYLDDAEFNELMRKRSKDADELSMVERVNEGQLLERKLSYSFNNNGYIEKNGLNPTKRMDIEHKLFEALSETYPELNEYEVIIDIPEPINFETYIRILKKDATIADLDEDMLIFSRGVSREFGKHLRKVSLFLPSYVETSIASKYMEEIING